MSVEVLAFANFDFKVKKVPMKVIIGGRVEDAERYMLNWPEYIELLTQKGLDLNPLSRAFFSRYESPRPDPEFFHNFKQFQAEIRQVLDTISQAQSVPREIWEMIFREAEGLREVFVPDPPCESDVGEEEYRAMRFKKYVKAETYRTLLFGQLRDLIVNKQLFRLKKCPECGTYFLDQTKNRSKIYCSSRTCGNRAKQRAFQRRRRAWAGQASLFDPGDDLPGQA